MNITRTSYIINTIMPDGTVLANFDSGVSPASLFRAAIGETKEVEILYTLSAGQDFVGKILFITGGTLNIGNSYPSPTPTSGYRFAVTGATANSIVYNANYIGCSNNGAPNELFKVTVTFTDLGQLIVPQTVTVKFQQILGYDIENYRLCDFYDNQTRLLKSLPADASNLLPSANTNSFYNSNQKVLSAVLHVTQGISTPFRDELQLPLQAGWYFKDPLDAPPYFSLSAPVELTVNGTIATGISPVKNTKVKLSNSCPVQPDKCIAILIDTTNSDQAKTWWENYDYSAAEVITDATIGTSLPGYNEKFVSPSQAPTHIGGGIYESFFEIDYNLLTAGNKYRIIWILYNVDLYYGTDDKVNSFISDEFTADYYEPFNGDAFTLTGKISDYQTVFTGNDLEVVPEERIKAIIDLKYYDGVTNSLEDDLTRRFVIRPTAIPADIRSSLKQIDIVLAWDETIAGDLYTHEVDAVKIIRTGLNTYLLPNGTEFIATGIDTSFPAFEQACRLAYTFRVRYEDDILCNKSYKNGVLQPLPLASQNWIGKTILINWRLTFEYEEVVPIVQDVISFQHQIRPKDYENNRDQADRNLDFLAIDDEVQVVCEDDTLCPVSTKINLADDYRHIVNLDRTSYKVQNIEEEETWDGVLPISSSNKLTDVASDYVYDTADFCVDVSALALNKNYKYAAIAKKLKDPSCIEIQFEIESPQTGGLRIRLQLLSGYLTIYWGDGNTTNVTSATGIQTFIATHAAVGVYDVSICGNCENISYFDADVLMDAALTNHQYILSADLTRLESDLNDFGTFSISASRLSTANLLLPTTAKNFNLVRFRGFDAPNSSFAPFNTSLTTLDLSTMSGNFTAFEANQLRGLTSIVFNSSTIIGSSFVLSNTALNQVFDFGTKIFASIVTYRCVSGFASSLSQANLDANIYEILNNGDAYELQTPGMKTFTANGTNPAPSGSLVAPPGYIQADAVTAGNNGSPTTGKHAKYILDNQCIDFTITRRYTWTINVN